MNFAFSHFFLRTIHPTRPPLRVAIGALLAGLLVLGGCKPKDAREGAQTDALRVVASADLPAPPHRIVSLAPNVTEVLFAVGAGAHVVGVTRYDDYPPQVTSLPKIGGIIDVDLEAVLAQHPDLVVGTSAGANAELVAKLEKTHLAYLFIQMDTLDHIYEGIQKFGDAVGQGAKATEVTTKMRAQIDAISRDAARQKARPRVLLVFGHHPLVAAGPGSFGHQLVELAGGQNVLENAKTPYPNLDVEKVLSLNPELIIDATIEPGSDASDTRFWAQYPALQAVQDGRVYHFQNPVLLRPAPRLVEGLKILHKAIRAE